MIEPESLCGGERCGVPVAVAGGQLTLKVTVRQSEVDAAPKLEVEGFLGTLHLLLSPHQLSLLQEMVAGIAAQGSTLVCVEPVCSCDMYMCSCDVYTCSCDVSVCSCDVTLSICAAASETSDFERLPPGQSRPIPSGDRSTLESQLSRHQLQQRSRVPSYLPHKGQDLLDADPWENTAMPLKPHLPPHPLHASDSMCISSNENFYSLDLNTSSTSTTGAGAGVGPAGMEDSFLSTTSQLLPSERGGAKGVGLTVHRRCSDDLDEFIALHEGVGLQQLSQSPPHQHPSSSVPRKPSSAPQPSRVPRPPGFRYSFAVSGVTVALLEADPVHTYTTPLTTPLSDSSVEGVANTGCSMDEGGLDPVKYFELVSELLRDGVNQHQLELHHKTLAQILPADHLMLVRVCMYVCVSVSVC